MNFIQEYSNQMGFYSMYSGHQFLWAILIVWSLIWKGIALWKAARNNEKYWYVALLVINTVGILEIIYILFFDKKKSK